MPLMYIAYDISCECRGPPIRHPHQLRMWQNYTTQCCLLAALPVPLRTVSPLHHQQHSDHGIKNMFLSTWHTSWLSHHCNTVMLIHRQTLRMTYIMRRLLLPFPITAVKNEVHLTLRYNYHYVSRCRTRPFCVFG
jgi:hypothetical protein